MGEVSYESYYSVEYGIVYQNNVLLEIRNYYEQIASQTDEFRERHFEGSHEQKLLEEKRFNNQKLYSLHQDISGFLEIYGSDFTHIKPKLERLLKSIPLFLDNNLIYNDENLLIKLLISKDAIPRKNSNHLFLANVDNAEDLVLKNKFNVDLIVNISYGTVQISQLSNDNIKSDERKNPILSLVNTNLQE